MPDEPPRSIVLPLADKPPGLPKAPHPLPDEIPDLNGPGICKPSHHNDDNNMFPGAAEIMTDMRRNFCWAAFRADLDELSSTYSIVAAHVSSFNVAEKDESLQKVSEFIVPEGRQGNVHHLANQQKVGDGDTKVGDVFRNLTVAGSKVSVGTEAEYDKNAAKKAGKSPEVKEACSVALQADNALAKEIALYDASRSGCRSAGYGIEQALAQLEITAGKKDEAEKKDDLQHVQQAKADTLGNVKLAINVVELIGGLAAGTKGLGVADDIAGNGAHDLIGTVAEKIVDGVYETRIHDAERKLAAAQGRTAAALDKYDLAGYNKACAEWVGALATMRAWRNGVQEKLGARKLAYDKLGRAAGKAAGGGKTGERIQAAIAAIPIAETVVARADDVLTAIEIPTPSIDSMVGCNMARASGSVGPALAMGYVRQLHGAQEQFGHHKQFWQARLTSLRGVVSQLVAGAA